MGDSTLRRTRALRGSIMWPEQAADRRIAGGKAASLAALARARIAGCEIPRWFAIRADASIEDECFRDNLAEALDSIAPNGEPVAVRSSSVVEDGSESSYAGQLESYLFVAHEDVIARVRDVQRSAGADRVGAYEMARGRASRASGSAVIVQRMVRADTSGVAFSADPVSGRRGVAVVAATRGTSEALVSGSANAEEWRIDRHGRVVEHRTVGETNALDETRARRVTAAARACARHHGVPQDIEWAYEGDHLFLLQSRPITSLAALPDPDGSLAIWDNSNIAESYAGVTTPLTYSFARHAYEHVYRRFLILLGVRAEVVEGNADALRKMIGLIRGRVYYNMGSWYRALALLPGFSLNRPFMEQMMGVREPVPDALSIAPATGRVRALWDVARAALGLLREHRRIDRSVRRFHARVAQSLVVGDIPLEDMRADELVSHYRALESRLLAQWDAPLANDFFAMVHFGVLRVLAARWCGDADGTLPNDLVAAEGRMISAEPARAIRRMSTLAATIPGLPAALAMAEREAAMNALRSSASLVEEFRDYIARFGDRCAGELKLETQTLSEDPLPLLRAIGEGALLPAQATEEGARAIRERAERRASGAMRWRPFRRMIFNGVLRRARARVRDRENLRFERTRVFGRVRQIVLELGKRFTAARLLDEPRDVFYLEIHEVLSVVEGTATSVDLRSLASARRAEFERYLDDPAPAERFETHGMVHEGNRFAAGRPREVLDAESLDMRHGTGCYPGRVRGTVRVVLDPHESQLRSGEILVAERTDPGWIMLFPRAAGILVERGSLLSHSAIVSRELGIPSIVAIAGLTSWLRTGDVVELDGRSGVVRVIELARETGVELAHDE